jgi:hypothetical protein
LHTRVIGVSAIIAAIGVFAVVACGSGAASPPSTGCEPGTKESCTGPNLCSGKQVCKADRTYDACVCPPLPDASLPDVDPPPPPDAGKDAAIVEAGPDAKPFDPKPLTWIRGVDVSSIASVAVDGNHDILVVGQGGNGNITKLDATGALLWAKTFLAPGAFKVSALAVAGDLAGNAYVVVDSPPNTDYGGGPIVKQGRVLLKLDVNGNYVWHYGPLEYANVMKMVTRSNGNVVLAGETCGPTDFGAGIVSPAGACDGMLVELTPSKALVKAKQFGDGGWQSIQDVALDPNGNAYVVGYFNGTLDFGKGAMTGPPGSYSPFAPHNVFAAKLDSALNGLAQKNGGGSSSDYLHRVAVDPFGNVALAGSVNSTIQLGTNPVTAFTGADIYLAYLDPSLAEIWSGGYGGYAGQGVAGLAPRTSGGLVAFGNTNGTLSFGLGGLPVGTAGMFAVTFDTAGNPVSNFGASVAGGSVTPQGLSYLGGTDYVFAGTCQGGSLTLPSPYACNGRGFVTRRAP